MADKDKALTKAAAAYEAMLAEVLRNREAGRLPTAANLSDRLAEERAQQAAAQPISGK